MSNLLRLQVVFLLEDILLVNVFVSQFFLFLFALFARFALFALFSNENGSLFSIENVAHLIKFVDD